MTEFFVICTYMYSKFIIYEILIIKFFVLFIVLMCLICNNNLIIARIIDY